MRKGDIVAVVGSKKASSTFLGDYGIIKDIYYEIITVEVQKAIPSKGYGALSITAVAEDLELVGRINE